ncbi:MAG: uracil-DNA glycosylase [Planctomycetaceae bacterium]|nr:MAG: uracil-DNA glycosylase [Planctomycetaceae bacterium]
MSTGFPSPWRVREQTNFSVPGSVLESNPSAATVSSEQVRRLIEHLGRSGIQYLPRGVAIPSLIQVPAAAAGVASETSSVETGGSPARISDAAGDGQSRTRVMDKAPGTPVAAVGRDGPGSGLGAGGATGGRVAGGGLSAVAGATVTLPITDPYSGEPLAAELRGPRLAELAAEVASCVRCESLVCNRRNTVFGEGDPSAKICFFGEAPGQEEDATGRPFVGASGQLLTRMIEACKLSRDQVYILNTIKCRPPNNRTPELAERENCKRFYEEQFRIIRPDYIVCLGLVAAQSLLTTTLSIGRMRGRFHRYHDSKVVVTYHPSYLLRTPAAKREAWNDLKMLMADIGIDLSQR